jgi:hypothetical protein
MIRRCSGTREAYIEDREGVDFTSAFCLGNGVSEILANLCPRTGSRDLMGPHRSLESARGQQFAGRVTYEGANCV